MKQELIAGRISIGGDRLSSSLAEVKSGKLKALATTASRRIPELPKVPTVRELGFPGLEAEGWNGLFAPGKLPQHILNRLNKEAIATVRPPNVAKRIREMGAESVGSTPAEQDAILRRQVEQFRPIVQSKKWRIEVNRT